LWGLLVGDALGVPYEFHGAGELPGADAIEMEPPPGFRRAHPGVPPGTWSDDGAHALCLLASLEHCGRLDVGDLARRLLNWYQFGYLTPDSEIFDVGVQTLRALDALAAGAAPLDAGPVHERANGNGSLMRVLPLALWHRGDDGELVADARAQSRVTHGHARSQLACALYCLWARRILDGVDDPWREARAALRQFAAGEPELAVLERELGDPPRGSGYVVDCLRSAVAVQAAGSYEGVVKAAIALGDDTDTTACVAGGIAGLLHGVDAIPRRWMQALRGQELAEPLAAALLAR
jgi:ADP-ribosylglycohydrolase